MKLILLIIVLFSGNLYAQTSYQTDFKSKVGQSIVELNYSWSGFKNVNHNISFTIDKYELENSYADFKKPKETEVVKYVNDELIKEFEKINSKQNIYHVDSQISADNRILKYTISGRIKQPFINRINNYIISKEKIFKEDYFKKNYFIYNDKSSLISIDYARISNIYISKIQNVATAFKIKNNKDIYNRRLVINDILSFYQSIPYDTLSANRGEGFSTPLKFLYENKGDCDTKLVIINATIKSLYPDIKTVAIILPNHVLLGVALPDTKNSDKKVSFNGITYVLTETAGPALVPLGTIAPTNESLMMVRNYSIIEL